MTDNHLYNAEIYMEILTRLLKAEFGDRLVYTGLQGSYERGEATFESDIDPMVLIESLTVNDLSAYRRIIESMERPDKSCGFLADAETLRHWNALESFSLIQSTRDHYGALKDLVPAYTRKDIRDFALLSANNLLHEITHRFLHAPTEKSAARLPSLLKGVFFLLQHTVYLEKGVFPKTKKALSQQLSGSDKTLFDTLTALKNGESLPFAEAFAIVFDSLNQIIRRL